MMKPLTSEQMVGIWEDQRELKNLMGKICYTFLLKKEKEMTDSFWSRRPGYLPGNQRRLL